MNSKLQIVFYLLSLSSFLSLKTLSLKSSLQILLIGKYRRIDNDFWTSILIATHSSESAMQQLVPPWLEKLLGTAFFSVCRTHGAAARSECNMYCLDCNGDAFCFYCRSSRHKDHQVIQIRRSSYHDVVRVSEIEKVLNIGGVQTYVINSARVLFLNERPQPKSGKAVSHICEICGRSLLDALRFCSLGCKLVGIKRNGNTSFMLEGISSSSTTRVISSSSTRRGEEELREGSQQDIYPPTPPPPPSTSSTRRRKGIPHRAPFGS